FKGLSGWVTAYGLFRVLSEHSNPSSSFPPQRPAGNCAPGPRRTDGRFTKRLLHNYGERLARRWDSYKYRRVLSRRLPAIAEEEGEREDDDTCGDAESSPTLARWSGDIVIRTPPDLRFKSFNDFGPSAAATATAAVLAAATAAENKGDSRAGHGFLELPPVSSLARAPLDGSPVRHARGLGG
ncbi:unnamed protein product, partial [Phaeothamnion confervicola]